MARSSSGFQNRTGAADLKVGDRVVIDVPENTSQALLIQIGAAAATTTTAHK